MTNLLSQIDFAKITVPTSSPGLINVNKADLTIGEVISTIIPYIFGAAAIALLIYLIIGGFQFMLSRGDPKASQAAQAMITNAVIGFVIIIIAFLLVQLIGQLFGLGTSSSFGQIFLPVQRHI